MLASCLAVTLQLALQVAQRKGFGMVLGWRRFKSLQIAVKEAAVCDLGNAILTVVG